MAYDGPFPHPVKSGGTGATTLTGVLIGNGTSAVTGNAITQHDLLIGGASNAITSVAPSATSGVPVISQGAAADPTFGTVVVAGGGTGATTLTGIVKGNGTSAFTAASPVAIADGGTNATTFGTTDGIVTFNSASLVTSSTAQIDGSGRYTNTTQPCCVTYLSTGAAVSNVTGDGSAYTILFDVKTVNVHTDYSSVTGKYTIGKTGRHLVVGSVGFSNIGAGHTAGIIQITTNTTSFQTGAFNYAAVKDSNSNLVIPFSSLIQFSASDTVWITVIVSNSTKTVGIIGSSSPILTYFDVILLA